MKKRKTKFGLLGLLLAPALLTGCPIYVDSWEVLDSGSSWGSPDVVIVGETTPAWIDIDRPKISSKKGARNPIIQSYTANITQVQPGQPITFTVVAHDPEDQPLQYNWSATGGTLSGNTGQIVSWDPPEKAGIYTVSVIVSNARGGATTGALNLTVKASTQAPAVPAATPVPTPSPAASVTPVPAASVTPAPTPVQTPTPPPSPAPTAAPSATPQPAAEEPATLMGTVHDDAGLLAGAEVLLTSGDPKVPFEAKVTTGADGKFKFEQVPPNVRLVLSARKAGYGEKLRTIMALSGTETAFDFDGTFALQKL